MKKLLSLPVAFALAAALLAPTCRADETARRIARILHTTTITLEFRDAPLDEVIRFISTYTGINIVIDPKVYKARSRDDLKVTLSVRRLKVANALGILLDFNDLVRIYKNGVLLITGRGMQPEKPYLRLYDIRDLMFEVKDFPGAKISLVQGGKGVGATFEAQKEPDPIRNPDFVADLLKRNTGGKTWDDPKHSIRSVGGFLVVVQTRSVHLEVYRMLLMLRSMR